MIVMSFVPTRLLASVNLVSSPSLRLFPLARLHYLHPPTPFTVSLQVATAIVKVALEEDLCTKIDKDDVTSDEYVRNFIARKMYFPSYVPLL
jgi:hypothetical protein